MSFKMFMLSLASAVMLGTAMRQKIALQENDVFTTAAKGSQGHHSLTETEEKATSEDKPEVLHARWIIVQAMTNLLLKGSKVMGVKRDLGNLDSKELLAALKLEDTAGWATLVQGKLNRKMQDEEQMKEHLAASRGADEATKEAEREKQRAKWAWQGTPGKECSPGTDCHAIVKCTKTPGLQVTFVKTANFHDSLEELTKGFAAANTMLAFDMDGTLAFMKEHFGEETVQTLTHAQDMSKVVVTARGNRNTIGCNTVLQTLVGDHGIVTEKAEGGFDCKGENGCDIKALFDLPNECLEEAHRMKIEPTETTMLAMQGLVMPLYDKARGLATYVSSEKRFVEDEPEHLIFYDDFVTNPVNMAEHFCFVAEGWPALKKITAVWYATPEAQLRDEKIASRLMNGEITPDKHSEGSFFAPAADNDAALAGQRAIFGLS